MRRFVLFTLVMLVSAACQLPTWDTLWRKPGGIPHGGTVTIALPDALDAVQPWAITSRATELFVSLTHAGLTRLDDRGMPQPELLADWASSSDQLVVTATLKADLHWSDTTPLTSADVVYTYSALKSLPASTPLLAELAVITQVIQVDDTHVRFELARPYAPLFSLWALPILPKHVLASQQIAQVNMRNLLTSAGPFVYKEVRDDGGIVLVANVQYGLGAPNLDAIVLLPQQNDATMRAGVQAGSIDIAELAQLTQPDTTPISTTTFAQNSMYLSLFNLRDGHVTSDVRVRKALAAVQSPLAQDVFLPASWAHATVTTTQVLSDSTTLLDAAGWLQTEPTTPRQHDGQTLAISLVVPVDNMVLMNAADVLAARWQQLGMVVERHNVTRDEYLQALIPPYAFDVVLLELANGRSSSAYADTVFYEPDVRALFDGAQRNDGMPVIRGSLNISGIHDTIVNALLARINTTYEITPRQHLYGDLITALDAQIPAMVLGRPTTTVIYRDTVRVPTGSMRFMSPWYSANAARWYIQPQEQ